MENQEKNTKFEFNSTTKTRQLNILAVLKKETKIAGCYDSVVTELIMQKPTREQLAKFVDI